MNTNHNFKSSKAARKWCFVPCCTNTSKRTPDKMFFNVPRDPIVRKKWIKAARREIIGPVSTATWFCCEDHFEPEKDIENYIRYKLVGGNILLRRGVVPHKFDCQPPRQIVHCTGDRPASVARAAAKEPNNFLQGPPVEDEDTESAPETCSGNFSVVELDFEENAEIASETYYLQPIKCDAATQTCEEKKTSDAGTQTSKQDGRVCFRSKAVTADLCSCGPDRVTSEVGLSRSTEESVADEESDSSKDGILELSVELETESETESSFEETVEEETWREFKLESLKRTRMLVRKKCMLYMGVPDHAWYIVELLSEKISSSATWLSSLDVVTLILRKIRLNESFEVLCYEFSINCSQASRIFRRFTPVLSSCMQQLIVWPDREALKSCLPALFIRYYSNVQSIINCFEVHIEKPTDAVSQSASWSKYKKAHTLKYVISVTPSGLVNFVSNGYLGKISDTEIIENSGYLDHLIPGMQVMAGRGFEHAEALIGERGCELVRLPTAGQNEIPSGLTRRESRRVADIRLHVERAIRRVTEFRFISPYFCIDPDLVKMTDDVVNIVDAN